VTRVGSLTWVIAQTVFEGYVNTHVLVVGVYGGRAHIDKRFLLELKNRDLNNKTNKKNKVTELQISGFFP
jgi:hypothetical protein